MNVRSPLGHALWLVFVACAGTAVATPQTRPTTRPAMDALMETRLPAPLLPEAGTVSLGDLLDYIADIAKVNVHVNTTELEAIGGRAFDLAWVAEPMTVRQAVDRILAQVNRDGHERIAVDLSRGLSTFRRPRTPAAGQPCPQHGNETEP